MAIKKIRMRPEGSNDYADVLHPETSASQVVEETNKRFMTDAERSKIANAITSVPVTKVQGRTGEVTISKADIGLSVVSNYGIATTAEAQAGTVNTKYMTPLRVKEAIRARVASGSYVGNGVSGRLISTGFKPSIVITQEVHSSSDSSIVFMTGTLGSNWITIRGSNISNNNQSNVGLVSSGFQVGNNSYQGNEDGFVYNWVAIQ